MNVWARINTYATDEAARTKTHKDTDNFLVNSSANG
jgi:hypothetical protein